MRMDCRREWTENRDRLVSAIKELGFPEELGVQVVRQLGGPKAMDRMIGLPVCSKTTQGGAGSR